MCYALVPVFERSSSPRRYSRHSYKATFIHRAPRHTPLFAELSCDTDRTGTFPSTCFPYRLYYTPLPGPTYPGYGPPACTRIHRPRQSAGLVPWYRIQLSCMVRHRRPYCRNSVSFTFFFSFSYEAMTHSDLWRSIASRCQIIESSQDTKIGKMHP